MRSLRFAATALLFAAISCGDATGPSRSTADLERARSRWRAQNLHTYAFELRRNCFCANTDRLYVAVVSDAVVEVLDLDTGQFVDVQLGETVDELFTFIQNAIDRPAYLIRAEYDPAQGVPTSIDYDGAAQIADDEMSIRVTNVHPIEPQTNVAIERTTPE
jgi:hypothetical protein